MIVSALLKAGANVEAANKNGYTALHEASYHGHASSVSALLKAGADIQAVTNYGTAALRLAARDKCTDVLYVLLAAGARMPEDGDNWPIAVRQRCEAAQARHEGMLRVAVPALREYFCDPLMMIMFAYAHAPVHRSDLPPAALEVAPVRLIVAELLETAPAVIQDAYNESVAAGDANANGPP